jgi:hypothetical protein
MPAGDPCFPKEVSSKKKGKAACRSFKGTYDIAGSLGAFFIEEEAEFLTNPIKNCIWEEEYDFSDIDDDIYLDLYMQKNFRRKSKPKAQGGVAKKVWPSVEINNKKENVEQRLAAKQLKRRGHPELEKKSQQTPTEIVDCPAVGKDKKKKKWCKFRTSLDYQGVDYDSLLSASVDWAAVGNEHKKKKNRWGKHNPRNPPVAQRDCAAVSRNALTRQSDVIQSAPFLNDFLQLQDRDLTPEDYDLLLKLDELVAKKTIGADKLNSFEEFLAGQETIPEQCSICMDNFQIGERMKRLPCTHFFHADCIEHWLKTVSLNCPLDGLPV